MIHATKSLRGVSAIALVNLGCFGVMGASIAQAQSVDRTSGPRANSLEEVIVTARRAEESLQQVPLSIVAVSGEVLEQRSIENLQDLGKSTPNLTFSEPGNSGRLGGVAFIRGIGQREADSFYDPAVGTYVDGVYMGRMLGGNLDMMDIERVEVLRGPQGTLFGKNTNGGAISIVTVQPDASADAFSGRVQLTTGSRDRFDAAGGLNVPLIEDRLALRIAASHNTQDGYGHRVIAGDDMVNTDRDSARAQLLFQPTSNFSALLSGDYFKSDESNTSFKLVDVDTSVGPVFVINNFTPDVYDERWLSAADYAYNGTGANFARATLQGGALTLSYDTGGAMLKSISAYRESDLHQGFDPDGSPVTFIDVFNDIRQDQVSQELQATGLAFNDRLAYTVGAYYFHEEIDVAEFFAIIPPIIVGFGSRDHIENDSVAVYGQGTYSLTDQLRLTTGLRYTEDEKTSVSRGVDGTRTVGPVTAVGKHRSTSVSPRLGLDYQWTPDVMTYVSVAQGSKSGGVDAPLGFEDETVWTYEAGLRSDLFNDHVRFNATAFYSDYEDLQIQITGSTVDPNTGGPVAFSLIANIPKASIIGAELELVVVPTPHWTFSGAVGLIDAQYDELPTTSEFNAFVAQGSLNKDTEFSHTPETSFTVAAEYNTSFSDKLEMTARVDYAYKSDVYFTPENTRNSLQPAFGLLNARVVFDTPSGLSVSLFGTNLTDEVYINGAFDDSGKPNPGLGFGVVNQGQPREWGVSLQKRF